MQSLRDGRNTINTNTSLTDCVLRKDGTIHTVSDRRWHGRAMPVRICYPSWEHDGCAETEDGPAFRAFLQRAFARFTARHPLHAEILRLREIEGIPSTSISSLLQTAGFPAVSAARIRQIGTKEARERLLRVFRELLEEEPNPRVRERVERFLRSIG